MTLLGGLPAFLEGIEEGSLSTGSVGCESSFLLAAEAC